MKHIKFNIPFVSGQEVEVLKTLADRGKFCGDGFFTKESTVLIEKLFQGAKILLTTSCTHALEMTAILLNIKQGDEVIMPSYTFVSTANAFATRGAKIVFVDVRKDTMNLDENKLEHAITKRTKVIVPVHYAGVSCNMDKILSIAKAYNLFVVEDAAQGIDAFYKGQRLGSMGDFGTLSFHETKNIHCGEGGALIINNKDFFERAEIIREKGTNRSKFIKGQVDKYTWVDIGSSFLPSELNAAFLFEQIKKITEVTQKRLSLWNRYYKALAILQTKGYIELPEVPEDCQHNAHMFYVKVADIKVREQLINYLKTKNIESAFHYIPLHSSPAGQMHSIFDGGDVFTTKESERLLRLPMHYSLQINDVDFVAEQIVVFFNLSHK